VKLVSITELVNQDFAHYIELQGKITTENVSYVTPRGMGGQVKAIFVNQGDYVKKGQLLMKLDDGIIQQNIKQVESQLAFAKTFSPDKKTCGKTVSVQKCNIFLPRIMWRALKSNWDW